MQCKECQEKMKLAEYQAYETHVWFLYECSCGETQELKDHTRNLYSKALGTTKKKKCKHSFQEVDHDNSSWLKVEVCSLCGQRKLAIG